MASLRIRNAQTLVSQLAQLPLFTELTDAQLEYLAADSKLLDFKRSEMICRRGERADSFFCVSEGKVKLALLSPNGDEKIVDIVYPNRSFGEAVMFLHTAYPVYAQAIEQSRVIKIGGKHVMEAIDSSPGFAHRMLAGMSLRLHRLINDLESYCLMNASQRVVGYILSEIERTASSGAPRVEVTLPVNKSILANRLNLSPETFSRVLHHLAEQGAIEVQGKTIHINDVEGLSASLGEL